MNNELKEYLDENNVRYFQYSEYVFWVNEQLPESHYYFFRNNNIRKSAGIGVIVIEQLPNIVNAQYRINNDDYLLLVYKNLNDAESVFQCYDIYHNCYFEAEKEWIMKNTKAEKREKHIGMTDTLKKYYYQNLQIINQ